MNTRGIVQIGVVFSLVFVVGSVVFFSGFSRAIGLEDDYVLGARVKLDLGDVSDYRLKITTPSTSYVLEGSNDEVVFRAEEIGLYVLQLHYGDVHESYSFSVFGELEEEIFEEEEVLREEVHEVPSASSEFVVSEDEAHGTSDEQIRINERVRWVFEQEVSFDRKVDLPSQAEEIRVFRGGESVGYTLQKNRVANLFSRAVSLNKDLGVKTLLFDEDFESVRVEYFTEPPASEERVFSEMEKQVVVSSPAGLHYENVFSYTDISELTSRKELITLYWKEEDRFLDFEPIDVDGNGLFDRVEWIIPHLSEQTFDIVLHVIDVQSYPVVGGKWRVEFVTEGVSDLFIRGFNGTVFGVDLNFLELRCGEEIVDYEFLENEIIVRDYSCDDSSFEVSRVFTEGKHSLEFEFGGERAYAFNQASPYQIIGEWGSVTDLSEGSWMLVAFNATFNDTPVVVHQVDYDYSYDNNPCSTRIRNVNRTGFEIRAESWSPSASCPGSGVNAYWLAAEKGTHALANAGTAVRTIEVQNFSMSASACGSGANPSDYTYTANLRNFQHAWSFQPLVLAGVQSANDLDVISYYIKGCSLSGNSDTWNTTCVQIGLNGLENDGTTQPCTLHTSDEEGGYIAWEMDSDWSDAETRDNNGTFGDGLTSFYWEAFWESDNVAGTENDASPLGSYSVTLTQSWSEGVAFGSGIRIDGGNGLLSVLDYDAGNNQVFFAAEEDEYGDTEQAHTAEPWEVLFFNASSGFLYSNVSSPPPQISDVNATAISDSSATIVWTTNEPSNSSVAYGTTLSLGSLVSSASFVNNHSVLVGGLSATTLYYYNVTSCSESTLCNTTGPFNFTTITGTPPTIFNITPANNSNVSSLVTLSVSTSEAATCEYSTSETFVYGSGTDFSSTGGLFHSTSLGALLSGSYTYYVKCEDTSSNANDDSNQGATTFFVDSDIPEIVLHEPRPGAIDLTSNTDFNFSVSDTFASTLLCNLSVNDVLEEQDILVSNGSSVLRSFSFEYAPHNWSVVCSDEVGNVDDETGWFFFGRVRSATIGEAGVASVNASNWTVVSLTHSFINPVVVTGYDYPFDDSVPPVSVRMRNVQSDSFEVSLQFTNTTAVPSEVGNLNVTYLVVEQGFHYMEDGTRIEAHSYNTSTVSSASNGWTSGDSRSYNHTYSTAPIVLHQVMTFSDTNWITSFASADGDAGNPPTTSGFQSSLNGAEGFDTHGTETLGYVVIEIANGTNDGVLFESQISGDIVEGVGNDASCTSYVVNFDNSYLSSPLVIESIQSMDGANGGWGQHCSVSTSQTGLRVEEDQFNDGERSHITEDIAVFVFGSSGTLVSNTTLDVPHLFDVNATSVTDSSATIVWNSDISANSTVYFGLANSSYSFEGSSSFVLNHSVTLTSLAEGTTYFYDVESCSATTGTCNVSGTFNFTTGVGEPPLVFNITPVNASVIANPVTLSVSTSEAATCEYSTSETFVYGSGTDFSSTGGLFHSTSLGSLGEGTHTYYVKCEDGGGNANDDSNQGETTFFVDVNPPTVVLNAPLDASNVNNQVTFNWTATDVIDSALSCDLVVGGSVQEANVSSLSGEPTTTMHLFGDGAYSWNVTCRDDVGNVNTSETRTFVIGALISVNLSSDALQYNQGSSAVFTINTSDLLSNPLQSNTTTDIILGTSLANSNVWWNSSWPYRQSYRFLENSGAMLMEYQINLTLDTFALINESRMNADCSDVRLVDNYGRVLDFYVQNASHNGCNTTATNIWVKLDSFVANTSEIVYVYYGNNNSELLSNEFRVFNYSSFEEVYYVVSDSLTNVDVVSFSDGVNVSNGTTYASLDRGDVTSFGVGQNGSLSSTGPIFAAGDENSVDALVPISFAGTEFVYAVNRNNDIWNIYSPFGDAEVCVYDGNDGSGWNLAGTCVTVPQNSALTITRNIGGTSSTVDAANTDSAMVNSTLPVLVTHDTDGNTDAFALYPAATDWWGVPSTRMTIGVLEDSTTIQVYYSDGSNVNYSRDHGEDIYLEGFSTGGQDSAVHVTSNNPIGVLQEADQDGAEMTTFLPEYELGNEYFFPQTASYVAVSATYPSTNCTLYDDLGAVLSSALTGSVSRPFPNKWFYGPSHNGNNIPAGSRLLCDEPVFAYYEQFGDGGDDDEHNVWGIRSFRKRALAEPSLVEQGSEEQFIARNVSETDTIGIHVFSFDTTSHLIENYTAVTLAETQGFDNGTDQLFFEILPPITNQPPVVFLTNPSNGTIQNDATISLFYNVSDENDNIANSTLILNGVRNETNQSTVLNGAISNFTISLANGVYTWTVNASDTTDLEGTNTSVRSFTIDTQPPVITLSNPLANESLGISSVFFNFSVNDVLDSVLVCDLVVDGAVEEDDFSAQSGALVNFTKTFGEGIHLWNVTCVDDATNVGVSVTRNFTVTEEPPRVALIGANNTFSTIPNVTLEYNATDNNVLIGSQLVLNGVLNQTNQSAVLNGAISNFSLVDLAEGLYTWTVNVTDDAGLNATNESILTFLVDLNDPVVSLAFPLNESVSNLSTVDFNFSVVDSIDTDLSCTLSVGSTIDGAFSASNGSVVNRQLSGLPDGALLWNVSCLDDSGRSSVSETRVVSVAERPTVQLDTLNNTFYNVSSFNLSYTPTDNGNFSFCELYIDGVFNQTNQSTVLNGEQQNFSISGISEGVHTWYVSCNDTIDLTNQSEVRTFTVDLNGLSVELLAPSSGLEIFSDSVVFSYNVTDNIDPTLSCDILVDSTIEDMFNATSGSITNRTVVFASGGTKFWNVTCTDDSSNSVTSATRNFTLAFAPVVTLNSPANNSFQNSSTIDLFYDVQDDNNNLANATLILNGLRNQTNQSALINEATNNFTIGLPDGVYTWTVNASDTTSLEGTDVDFRAFTIDTTPPTITLHQPENFSFITWNNYSINFTADDNLDGFLACGVYVNGVLNVSVNATSGTETLTTNVLPDGVYAWNVSCVDDASNVGWSATYNFTMEAPPNVTLLNPIANFVSNVSSIDFEYFVDDPLGITNCTLYINDSFVDSTEEPSIGATNIFTVNNLDDAHHNWTVECIDASPDFNLFRPFVRNVTVDTLFPLITLNSPVNGTNVLRSVDFNFSVVDNLDLNLSCDLYTDDVLNVSAISILNGSSVVERVEGFSLGIHTWNVSCVDNALNRNWSELRVFNVTLADLLINRTDIVFNSSSPTENESVLINASIHNLENVSVEDVVVQFYQGDPDDSGFRLGSNQTIDLIPPFGESVVSVSWEARLGTSEIFVVVDPPISSNGTLEEWNEDNNEANRSITVGGWHFIFGAISSLSEFALANPNNSVIRWNAANFEEGNVYVSDSESIISWTNLQAIGKTSSDSDSSNDFSEIDTLLNMTDFADSLTGIYLNASGDIHTLSSFIVFDSIIDEVPVANSTNNTNFVTGILWDTSDDTTNEFDSSEAEDVVFLTAINKDQQGAYGFYDYEMRVPARLRSYREVESRKVVFYSELR